MDPLEKLQVKQELGAHTGEDILRKQVCYLTRRKEAGADFSGCSLRALPRVLAKKSVADSKEEEGWGREKKKKKSACLCVCVRVNACLCVRGCRRWVGGA